MNNGSFIKSGIQNRQMTISESPDTGMIILSTTFHLMSINPAACKILGISPQPGKAYPLEKLFNTSSFVKAHRAMRNVLNNGVTLNDIHFNLVHENGRQIPCSVCALPLFAGEQEIIGVIVRFYTVSEKFGSGNDSSKLAYLPRIDYRHLFDGLPEGVFTIDTQWRINSFNAQAEQLTGFKKEQVIGKFCWQVFQSGRCRHECPFADIFNQGDSCESQEMTIVNHKGSIKKILVNVAPLKDENGTLVGGIESFSLAQKASGKTIPFQVMKPFEGMVGKSKAMKMIFDKLPDIAQSPVSVLITGESGTGKELIARAIHNLSKPQNNTFQAVNCSALPETLLESELFGHEKGAFTGADQSKPGRFELAANGTFFLDEIGDMKPSLQVKLLRVLEQKVFERVGSDKSIKLTARIIAATHQNLETAQKTGQFREDLYYRLRTIPIHLPPLRERTEDIPLLVTYFIKKFNHQYNKQVRLVDPAVLSSFSTYAWPGNIRELERVMEHAFVFVKGPIIFSRYLPANPEFEAIIPLRKFGRKKSEKEKIIQALDETGNKRTQTASLLGISRSSLWRKMKTYGLLNQSPTR
ncbi:MAG: PAS domain-containing protein [Desulfobacteraceae bacterium]|nr:PAS domain-containing protein [Desulfobacteraceae bacterium]